MKSKISNESQEQYENDRNSIRTIIDSLDEKESMLISKVEDSLTNNSTFRSRVTDSRLSTIAWERSGRVMGQLPKGMVKAISLQDKGKAMLMDVVLQRYILENANSQYSHLMKLRLWDLYSMVYGVMPMMYDYRIDDDYVGPDSWLIPIRNWTPQQGKMSMQDSDYTHIDNFVGKSWLEKKLKAKVGDWNEGNIKKLLAKVEDGARDGDKKDQRSYIQESRENQTGSAKGKNAQIKITTRYEGGEDGRWVTFAPEYDGLVIRDIKNPHKSGKIPVVLKYCFPLIDSIYGLGDFERGKTLQYAMDSLINLYLDGVKMSIFPPTIMNPSQVVPSSIRYSPGAKWLESIPNSIRSYNVNPQGMGTFQSTYSFLIGSLLNQNGTTDVAQNQDSTSDPGFGKTPEALKLLQARENTRDNWDRFMMEESIEELYCGFINLVAQKQPKPIEVNLFGQEIEQIEALYPDVKKMLSKSKTGKYGKLTLDTNTFGKDTEYKYYIDANSTSRKAEADQSEALTNLLVAVSKIPGLQQELSQEGIKYSMGEHLRRIFATSGVEDYDKILYPLSDQEKMEQAAQAQAAQNPNQPPQVPGGQGGDVTPPSMAEPMSPEQQMQQEMMMQQQMPAQAPSMAAPEGVDPNTIPAQANPETGQFAYIPQKLQINPNINDPEIQQIANELLGG